jgi:thiamine-phosphate pyrophosphorylase
MELKVPPAFGLYAILTDPSKGYEYMTRLFVDYKIAFIQLRMKKEAPGVIALTAEKLLKIIEGSDSRLIINDSPEIASMVGAHGVHIGQNDVPYEKARSIIGQSGIIGISTHTPGQTTSACELAPDYIGIGPVFPTPTKANPDPVITIAGLKKSLSLATVPAVAIGGIDLSNLRDVLFAGAKNFCMVRQLMNAANPEKTLKEVLAVYKESLTLDVRRLTLDV